MSLELKGRVIAILDEQTGTSNGKDWKKREFIIETIEQYPKKVSFTAFNKMDMFQYLKVGTVTTVSFNAESKEHNGKWFTNLSV